MAKARAITKHLPPGYEVKACTLEVPSLPDGALYTRMGEDMLIVGYENAQNMRTGYDRWLNAAHEIKRLQALVDQLREGLLYAEQTLHNDGFWSEAAELTAFGWQDYEPGKDGEIAEMQRRERSLLAHLRHHKVKQWLQRGAKREEAQTIADALDKTSSNRINVVLAKALARNNPRALSTKTRRELAADDKKIAERAKKSRPPRKK